MKPDELRQWIGRLRSDQIHRRINAEPVDPSRETVMRVLPHRDPFLLVDRIREFNPAERTLLAESDIQAEDPVFRGHFPDQPVYPAALQIEAIGQAGMCLWCLAENGGNPAGLGLRVARVVHAEFHRPIVPGDVMVLQAVLIHADDLTTMVAGQSFVDGTLCSTLIVMAVIVDE